MVKTEFIINEETLFKRELCEKTVLDVGCAGCSEPRFQLHDYVVSCKPKHVLGIDTNKEMVLLAKKTKRNVIYGNAENFKLDKKFDIILVADVIEHLDNQGLFLENVKRNMRKDSRIIITTPNIFCPVRFILRTPSEEHILNHSKDTLVQLLKKHNYIIENFYYSASAPNEMFKSYVWHIIFRLLPFTFLKKFFSD